MGIKIDSQCFHMIRDLNGIARHTEAVVRRIQVFKFGRNIQDKQLGLFVIKDHRVFSHTELYGMEDGSREFRPYHPSAGVTVMEVETVSCLLSGASARTTPLGRACLAVLFCLRLGALAIGAKTLWRHEERDFTCNSSSEICHSSCFDAFSPVSPFNFFTLQLVVLLTQALALANYSRQNSAAKGRWLRYPFKSRAGLVRLHFLFLLAKMAIECIFLITFCELYGGLLQPGVVKCHLDQCEEHVACLVHNSSAKNVFNVFMLSASFSCILLCLAEACTVLLELRSKPWTQEKPLVTQKANV
ncbi:gap junction beta-2 protein-like [Ambystoma mexicanum]|uniref:gap junction beta-2 protein-like n=1 Tax=Ambystoma mexicanum TaxID=8296 RepID=UPI0037E97BE5